MEPDNGADVDGMFADIADVSMSTMKNLLDDEEELTTDPAVSSRSLFNRRGPGSVGSTDTASEASDDDDGSGSGSGSGIGAPSFQGLGTTLWGS